jgi:hypothetical protein
MSPDVSVTTLSKSPSASISSATPQKHLKQSTILKYFPHLTKPAKAPKKALPSNPSLQNSVPNANTFSNTLILHHILRLPKFLTKSLPSFETQSAWGHSLPVTDPSQTF